MRMDAGLEGAAASAAEGSVAPEATEKAAQRLLEMTEERNLWISRRKEALKRKGKLLKLLQLQGASHSKNKQIETQKANNEGKTAPQDDAKAAKGEAAVLARKKELRELQARAVAAREKQQAAASVLTRNLRQLSAKNAAKLSGTQRPPLSKRKREDEGNKEQPSKKVDVGKDEAVNTAVAASKMHPCEEIDGVVEFLDRDEEWLMMDGLMLDSVAAGSGVDVGTQNLATAACFRIATRHFVQTGKTISKEELEDAFKNYTGKELEEAVDRSLLKRSLACLDVDGCWQRDLHSTLRAQHPSTCWQPGRQFLNIPTFIATDADQIQALIEVEKQVVVNVCDLPHQSEKLNSSRLVSMLRQRQFLGRLLGGSLSTRDSLSLSNVLSAWVGVNSMESPPRIPSRVSYRSHAQVAGVFVKMEKWLHQQAETSEPHNISSRFDSANGRSSSGAGDFVFSSKFAKPFCVADDSVVKQLREVETLNPAASKKIDPMKIFCQYELNGVCNDKNCSNYHQKDYAPLVNEMNNTNDCAGEEDAPITTLNEMDQLLLSFAEFRGRITTRWPMITTDQASSTTAEKSDGKGSIVSNISPPGPADRLDGDIDGTSAEGSNDFLELDTPEELPEIGDARYFDDIESRRANGDALQTKVEEDPNDTDAWILLAIYHLKLDVGLSDEAVNVSNDVRLQHQLVWLSKELNVRHRGGTSRSLNIEEPNLKRCLRTLSRALEVEANAYCEALWLLYLHLCTKVTNKQTEVDMVEQAVQFLPNSHALWLRYISTYDFDSVNIAEGIYWRLLEHLSRGNSTDKGSNIADLAPRKDLSILLTAICFHFCIKMWHAGATNQVRKLLYALLQFGDTPSELEWCKMMRARLCDDETVVLCLVFAHILLFNEPPALIEHWVSASSYERVPVNGIAYTADSLHLGEFPFDEEVFSRVLELYELAFQTYKQASHMVQDAVGIILNNWALLLALQGAAEGRDKSLELFFKEKLDMIQQFPAASLTAAKIIGSKPSGEEQAHQVMLAMMNQSSEVMFPEALHHYLFACRDTPALVNALDKTFPDVMERLGGLLTVDVEKVKKAIQGILDDSSNISKSREMKALLGDLLTSWMDQLTHLRRGSNEHESKANSLANIYVALDICHLMGILLEPSVAIDGLQMVLCSSSFGALPLEARQLAWMQRFVFQVDLLQQENSDSVRWREQQAELIRLFRKYMNEMSVAVEMVRQVTKRIGQDVERNSIEDAVCDCLYPERSRLLTYDINLEIFRLCSAAVAGPEKAAFYASFTDALALSPDFSLALSDVAVQEWELLATRASLRKCLVGAKTRHPQILQALVAVELRLRNMKSVSSLLESEMQADPLLLETWRLALGLEILFGENSDERSKKLAKEMEMRQLVLACNTFGDEQILHQTALSTVRDPEATSVTLRGVGMTNVPNAVLLKDRLISLDLSGNELAELPKGLQRLKKLQNLNASENALVKFPACVSRLAQLKELGLAHNNVVAVPVPALQYLNAVDVRWNAITRLPASDLAALKSLRVLHAKKNAIPSADLTRIAALLSNQREETPHDKASGGSPREQAEGKHKDTSTVQRVGPPEAVEVLNSIPSTVVVEMEDTEMTSISAEEEKTTSAAKEDDGDEIMEKYSGDTPAASKEAEDDVVEANEANATTQPKGYNGDKDMVQEYAIEVNDPAPEVPTRLSNPVEQPKEVIYVDSPESSEDGENETAGPEDQRTTYSADPVPTTNTSTEDTADSTNTFVLSSSDEPSTDSIAEAEDFAQDHYTVTTAASARQNSSPDAATTALAKLTAYMKQNHIESRTEVHRQNPVLWREFLSASLPVNVKLPACRMCFAPNDGHNQRFNSTVLCMHCLEEALQLLKEHNGLSQEVQGET